MAFLKDVKLPSEQKSSGGFISSVILPKDQNRANRIAELEQEAILAKKKSEESNRFGTIIKETIKGIPKAISQTKYAENIKEAAKDINKGNLFKGITKAAFRSSGDVVIDLYKPISIAVGAALKLTGGSKLIDDSGRVVADKSGVTDIPAFQRFAMRHPNAGEDFDRVLNLLFAKAENGKIEPARMQTEINMFVNKILNNANKDTVGSKKLNVVSETGETQVPVSTPMKRFGKYSASQGYEPYIPPEKLPTIDMGPKGKATEPVIQTQPRTSNKLGDLTVEPIIESPAKGSFLESVVGKRVQEPTVIKDNLLVERGISKTSLDIKERALADKITEDFGDIPTYKVMNMADQAQKALDLLGRDPERAKKIAMGESPAPEGLRDGSVFTAVREKAFAEGDVATLRELSKSKIAVETAQALKSFDTVKSDTDVVKILQDIQSSREKTTLGNKTLAEEVRVAKRDLPKVEKVPQKTWNQFIDELTC